MSKYLVTNSPHQNKKALSPFYHKKIFLIENECKTPLGCGKLTNNWMGNELTHFSPMSHSYTLDWTKTG